MNCTLYMGTDSTILENLPLAYIQRVWHPAKLEIIKQLYPQMNDDQIKAEFDRRYQDEEMPGILDDVTEERLFSEKKPKKEVFVRKRKEESVVLGYIKKGMTSNDCSVLPSGESVVTPMEDE